MEYRNLGRTGVKVSQLCLGTMMFGRRTGEADSIAMIDRALDAGINFVDTANAYAAGESERIVGKALAKDGRRQRTVLATKGFLPQDQNDPNARGLSRRHLIMACEASLRPLAWITATMSLGATYSSTNCRAAFFTWDARSGPTW